VDEFYATLEGVPEATVRKLQEYREQVTLMHEVVQLRPGVRLRRRERPGDPEGLTSFLREFECGSLIAHVDLMCNT